MSPALELLAGLVEPDTERLEVVGHPLRAIANGVLRGPSARCTYIASIACDGDGDVDPDGIAQVDLDMYVDELADLQLDLADLPRAGVDEVVALWIDASVHDAWVRVALTHAASLDIRAGACVLSARVGVADRGRMAQIVAVASAVAAAPARRSAELMAGLAALDPRGPARLRLDAPAAIVTRGGLDVEVAVRLAPAADRATRGVRTTLRASATGAPPLAIVDPTLARRDRPRSHGRLVERDGWLADSEVAPAVRHALAGARPAVVVVAPDSACVSLAGFVCEPPRLAAAVELLLAVTGASTAPPYR